MATSPDARRITLNSSLHTRRDAHEADSGVGARVLAWLREFYCSLHGHDNLMQFGKDRMFLQCVSCGHETPGWLLTEAPPRIVARGDSRRHALVRPRLVTARRIAEPEP